MRLLIVLSFLLSACAATDLSAQQECEQMGGVYHEVREECFGAEETLRESVEPSDAEATPRPTRRPTPSPRPTPIGSETDPSCSDWLGADTAARVEYAQRLLDTYGDADGSAETLTIELIAICMGLAGEANATASWIALVQNDPRFAGPTPTPVPTPTPAPTPVSYTQLSARDWQLVVKSPDNYIGNAYELWGCITQFDAATGADAFRAQASSAFTEFWFSDGENVLFYGDADLLADFVEDDVVSMKVISLGSFSYDTQAGGNTTVPLFDIKEITLQGSCA